MRLEFRGSLAEFQALFGSMGLPSIGATQLPEPPRPESQLPEMLGAEDTVPSGVGPGERSAMQNPGNFEDAVKAATIPYRPKFSNPQLVEAWSFFKSICKAWVTNFGVEEADQPDRVALMTQLGQGKHVLAVLHLALEIESLQRLIEKALIEDNLRPQNKDETQWLDYVASVAGNMVQVSQVGFPELAGMLDYSERWRRKKPTR